MFVIKTLTDKHTCYRVHHNHQVTTKFIAIESMPKFKRNPFYPIKDMEAEILEKYGALVSVDKCYGAIMLAHNMLKGTLEVHYGKVRSYLLKQKRIDPSGCFILQTNLDEAIDKCTFKRMYICYNMLKNAFKQGFRNIISLDGTFLKYFTHGALRVAIGKDCNNMMFLIALEVVEGENPQLWTWFL